MQVTVLEAKHNVQAPQKPVIAVQVGASPLRQATLDTGRQFVVSRPGDGATLPVEVSMWRQLGSGTIAEENSCDSLCTIPVDGTNVKLRVSRTGKKDIEKEATAKMSNEYLDKHNLQGQIQSLIEDVLRVQPDDPFRYMIKQLQQKKGGSEGDAPVPEVKAPSPKAETPAAEAPKILVPTAPAGPPPDKKNPRQLQAAPKAQSSKSLGLMVPQKKRNSREIMDSGREFAKKMACATIGLAYRGAVRRESRTGASFSIAAAYKAVAAKK